MVTLAAMTAALACGCATTGEDGLDSPVPGARLEAIEAVARSYRQTRTLPDLETRKELVECLHADDPLVRFMAIGTLEEIAGGRKGYRHDDPQSLRELAIPAWIAWAKDPAGASPDSTPTGTAPSSEAGR